MDTPEKAKKSRTANGYRKEAGDKAVKDLLSSTYIRQHGTVDDCFAYINHGIWSTKWGEKKPLAHINGELVKTALPVTNVETEPVNKALPAHQPPPEPDKQPIPVEMPRKKHKGVLANGRNSKGVPDFKNWFGRVYPVDITYPAWKHLSKTATDVANICRAKRDHAGAKQEKDSSGTPIFAFPYSEAVSTFKMTRPTFTSAIKMLLEIGFIEYSRHGGICNGVGFKAFVVQPALIPASTRHR